MTFIGILIALLALALGAISLYGLIVSIVLAIVFSKKKMKTAKIISYIVMIPCFLGMTPILLILGYTLVQSATIPESFVEVPITAEITNDGFVTADGETFQKLPYQSYFIETQEVCFAVKPEGFFRRSQWGNIYRFNADGYTLYYYQGYYQDYYFASPVLYCEADAYDEVLRYFEENCHWTQYFSELPCSAQTVAIIAQYKAMEGATEFDLPWEEYSRDIDLVCLSYDGSILIDECKFQKCNGRYFICTYSIIEDYYHDYGFELTQEEAEIIENDLFAVWEE